MLTQAYALAELGGTVNVNTFSRRSERHDRKRKSGQEKGDLIKRLQDGDELALEEVFKLADFPNTALKWAHAQSCFDVHDYPYQPIRGYLKRAIGAFGAERVMWASDSSVIPRHSWSDILHYVRDDPDLTEEEKAWVLGGSARKALNWQKN